MSVSGTCTENDNPAIFVYNQYYIILGVNALEMDFYGKKTNNGSSYSNTNGGSFYINHQIDNYNLALWVYNSHPVSYVNMTITFTLITTM
jgi:hypothetical protein